MDHYGEVVKVTTAAGNIKYPHLAKVVETALKVTVQFQTKRKGQNEIVSHMDRSDVKL